MRMNAERRDAGFRSDARVGDIALLLPEAVDVFERHGVDFCCGGSRTLAEACALAKASLDVVLADLVAAVSRGVEAPQDATAPLPADLSATALIDHIVATHHAFVKAELPRLPVLAARAAAAHAARHPEFARIDRLVSELRAELEPHLQKEEVVLFPYVTALDAFVNRGGELPASCFRSVRDPIRAMEYEHDVAGELLADLRSVARGYVPPEAACATTRSLFAGLEAFERDLHRHVHLENNALFPRALALEARR